MASLSESNNMDERLSSLKHSALVLSNITDLSPPQQIGVQGAILASSPSFEKVSNRTPLWKSFLTELEKSSNESPNVHLLWYHASLREALKSESSDGVLSMIQLVLSSSASTFKLPLMAIEVTYREIENALLLPESCDNWLVELMRQLVGIIIAPVKDNVLSTQDDDSEEIDYNASATIELIEASRCSASRLICLLIDKSVADPSGHTSRAFLECLSASSNNSDHDTSSFMYSKKQVTKLNDTSDPRTLFQCLDDIVRESLEVTSLSLSASQQARRETLLNELLPSFYSTLILPEIWANHASRNKHLWEVLQSVVFNSARGVGDLNACLGAACLLIGGADVSMKQPSLVSKYLLPSSTLWSLISLGLNSKMPLERRRAMHLLRTVVLLATAADSTPNTKQGGHQAGSKKKGQAVKTRVKNGNEWMSFLKAFEIYDNEFQLHLVEQVWPLLRGLCNGHLSESWEESSVVDSEKYQDKPFWEHPLPPMSHAMVRCLMGRSLSSENPAVVKFGLEKLFKGETCNLTSKNPALLFPPSWIRETLIHDILDDSKLYRDHTLDDNMGSLVAGFFRSYITSKLLPESVRKDFVFQIADAVSRNSAEVTHTQKSRGLKCHVTMYHLLSVFGMDNESMDSAEEESYGSVFKALSNGATAALDAGLLNDITDRILGSDRFDSLNSYMQAATLRGMIPLVTHCCDPSKDEDGMNRVTKFLSMLPYELFFSEPSTDVSTDNISDTTAMKAASSFSQPLKSFLLPLSQWCGDLITSKGMSLQTCSNHKGYARMTLLTHVYNSKKGNEWPELKTILGQVHLASTSPHMPQQATQDRLEVLHHINTNTLHCGGTPLNFLRTCYNESASGAESLGLTVLRLSSGFIRSHMSSLSNKENEEAQDELDIVINVFCSTFKVIFDSEGKQIENSIPKINNRVKKGPGATIMVSRRELSSASMIVMDLVTTVSGKFASNQIKVVLACNQVLHMLMESAFTVLFTSNIDKDQELSEERQYLNRDDGSKSDFKPSYLAPYLAKLLMQQLITCNISSSNSVKMDRKPTSKELKTFLGHKWGSAVILASAYPKQACSVFSYDLFEDCFSAASAVSKGFPRIGDVPLAIAYHAVTPLFAAFLNPNDGEPVDKREIYKKVSDAAWSTFEESGNFRPSISEALAGMLFQSCFFEDKQLLGCADGTEKSSNLLSDMLERFEILAASGRAHVLRAATARVVIGLSKHPEVTCYFVPQLVTLLIYREDRTKLFALPSETGVLTVGLEARSAHPTTSAHSGGDQSESSETSPSNNSSKLNEAFVRIMLLHLLEGIADNTSFPCSYDWGGEIAVGLLDVHLDLETNPVNPILNTPSYGRRLRSIQALCVVAPLIPIEFMPRINEKLWSIIQQPVTHMIRFYLDLFTARLSIQHESIMQHLIMELNKPTQSAQALSSHVTIAAYITFASNETNEVIEGVNTSHVAGLMNELVLAVLPYCLYPSSFVRTVAQIVCHKSLPEFLSSDSKQKESSSGHTLENIHMFLDKNSDIIKLRKKQVQFVKRLQPVAFCRVGEMLSHSDDFQEISAQSLSDLVQNNLRELYNESSGDDTASSHSTFFHDWSKRGKDSTSVPSKQDENEDNEDSEDEDEVGDIQRKIRVWWEGLELSSYAVKREMSATGRPLQTGLVVCASLIDKTPNLAGLTRTCEIFGASSLTLPNLQIIKTDEFRSISVTSEGWVNLQEVKEDDLLLWLQQKRREGFKIVGLEQTAGSVPLAGVSSHPFPDRTVLLLGKEREGIPAHLLRVVDVCFEIPQLGIVRSLNVHVSGAIAIWEYTRQKCLIDKDSAHKEPKSKSFEV